MLFLGFREEWRMRREGGGSVLLVLENSTHDTSNDVVQLFGSRLHWLLDKVTPTSPTIMYLSTA